MLPSARHFFESCPGPNNKLQTARDILLAEYTILPSWWMSQPAVTTKSAWITIGAAHCEKRRVQLQIAVAKFAILIVSLKLTDSFEVDLDEDLFNT